MKNVMFRRIGGRVVPIRTGAGVKLIDPIMKNPFFKLEQEKLKAVFAADSLKKILVFTKRIPI